MKLTKTTLMSALVMIAGILAEIIFRDTMSKSILGLSLSILLAIIVLGSAYLMIDGIYCIMANARMELEDRLESHTQEIKQLLEKYASTQMPADESDSSNEHGKNEIIKEINDNTINVGKAIAKYQLQSSQDVKKQIDSIRADILKMNRDKK